MIYDSVLSEFAALGFEYGYSVVRPRRARVLGGAVRRLRQRRADDHRPVHRRGRGQVGPAQRARRCCSRTASRARARSTRRRGSNASSCSAREDNIRVVYPTTAAQYFHVLRRQVHDPSSQAAGRDDAEALPAHARDVVAGVARSTSGGFRLVLPDPPQPDPRRCAGSSSAAASSGTSCSPGATRCTRRSRSCGSNSCTRGPSARSRAQLRRYPGAEVIWAQEEPGNMGARYFARRRIEEIARRPHGRRGRPPGEPEPGHGQLDRARRRSSSRCWKRQSPLPD